MNEQDHQLLSCYMDGELDDISRKALERRLAVEPTLRDALSRMQDMDQDLRQAFADKDCVPPQVAAMLAPEPTNVVALPQRKRAAAWQYAVAASLVAAAGLLLTPDWRQADTPQAGDILLSEALEVAPSSAEGWETLPDGRQLRAVLSFPGQDGTWCREFLLSDGVEHFHGVACREDAAWDTRAIAQTELPGSNGEYRPAGAGDSETVADYIQQHAADIPLSASQEAQLIEKGWQ